MSSELKNIRLLTKIAQGAFGEIYEGYDKDNRSHLAVKLEKKTKYLHLKQEFLIYRKLAGPNTPYVCEYGQMKLKDDVVNCMTMELLGLSLEKLFVRQGKKFSVKTIMLIGKACLSRIEELQHKHFIHRDIKPDNFVTDLTRNKLYLIDYGLTKYFRNPVTLTHISYKTDKNLVGTARYASLNTHRGIEQGRRDDLESLGYMLIYFSRGRLPWQGLKAETKAEKYAKIHKLKETVSIFELCDTLPNELYLYMVHVRGLGFDELPDYPYLHSIFENGLRSRGLVDDGQWDWLCVDDEDMSGG